MGKMKTNNKNIIKNIIFLITLIISISLISSNSNSITSNMNSSTTSNIQLNKSDQAISHMPSHMPPHMPPKTANLPNGWINIVGPKGYCIGSRLKNSNLTQQYCGDQVTLLWKIERNDKGGYYLINKQKDRVMYNSGNSIYGYRPNKSWQTNWKIESVGNGKFIFRNVHRKNYCVDNYGKAKINQIYRTYICKNKNENQSFSFETPKKTHYPAPEKGWFNIIAKSGLCLAARNNNGNVIQANCGDTDDLLWTFIREADGIRISNKTKRQMDAMGGSVYGYLKQNVQRQIWDITSLGNGKLQFRNYIRNTCIDDYGKNDVNGKLRMFKCDKNGKDQEFSFAPAKKMDLPKGWINIVGNKGYCMASRIKNSNLSQQYCGDQDTLLWKIERNDKGGYYLK